MRRWIVFVTTAAVMLAVNLAYTASAMSRPLREEWVDYMTLAIPESVGSQLDLETMAGRLSAAGYTTSIDNYSDFRVLAAGFPDPNYRAWADEPPGAWPDAVTVEIRCLVGYLRGDCGGNPEQLLRSHLATFLVDAAIPLDSQGGYFGDNDFAVWDEFGIWLGQLGLIVLAAVVVTPAFAYDYLRPRARKIPRVPDGSVKPF